MARPRTHRKSELCSASVVTTISSSLVTIVRASLKLKFYVASKLYITLDLASWFDILQHDEAVKSNGY